jgi:hypothetical protein
MSVRKHLMHIIILAAIAVIIAYIPVCAISGMVTKVSDSRIVINKGSRDSIAQDQELYVHRIGSPVGKLRVTRVDSLSSEAVVTSLERDEAVKVGDVVSTEPFSIPYTPPPPAEKSSGKSSKSNASGQSGSNDCSAAYLDRLKTQTRMTTFKKGPKGQVKVGIGEVSLLYNALSGVALGGGYVYSDPWMGFSVGSALYNQYNAYRNVGPQNSVVVAVTYYDDGLIDSQARYFASKEGITDESQIREIKNGVMQQMGTDTNMVFGVKICNQGSQVVQLAPFKWHFYLKDQSGQKVTAVKYDEQLDKGVEPRGETQGYIYFPKLTPGSSTSGATVRGVLESIMGHNADISW